MQTQLVDNDFYDGEESDEEQEDRGEAVAELRWKGWELLFLFCFMSHNHHSIVLGKKFPLYEGSNLIGRSGGKKKELEVDLEHATISELHAEIEIDGDKYVLKDLRSAN